jgi:Rieske Fe-S protein
MERNLLDSKIDMNKREFIKSSSAAAVLATFGLSLQNCSDDEPTTPLEEPLTVDISGGIFTALQSEDGWVLWDEETLLLINVAGSISVFSARCPHSGCSRDWIYTDNKFTCTCHGSQFSSTGDLLNGPAMRGLTRVPASLDGNTLTIG